MPGSNYIFEIDDRVVTIYGEIGKVTHICNCEHCTARGFNALTWVTDDGYKTEVITGGDAEHGFDYYYQIGKYNFGNTFDKDTVLKTVKYFEETLERVKKRLDLIEEFEKENM